MMLLLHDRQCLLRRIRGSIAPIAREGIIRVCNSNDPGLQWDLFALKAIWIAAPIIILVMVPDDERDAGIQAQCSDEVGSQLGVMLDHKILCFGKATGLVDDEFINGNLAYVMYLGGKRQCFDLCRGQLKFS